MCGVRAFVFITSNFVGVMSGAVECSAANNKTVLVMKFYILEILHHCARTFYLGITHLRKYGSGTLNYE